MTKPPSQFLTFWQFFSEAFVPLNNLELPLKPLHKGVCDVLERAYLGDLGKSFIVINIPPRVGKTKILEALSCWSHAYFPDAQNIYTSYSNELAKTSVRYIQQVMASPWYCELFPTRLGSVRQADHFTTTAGGKVYGDGVGGSLTGLGAGLKRKAGGFIAIDDPAKPDEALSRVEGEKVRFWFENTLKSRRNSSQWTPIIICAQRLAPDDLPGFILENYPDDCIHVKYPAMVDGESQIPETVSTKDLLDTQRVNPFAFAAQYQQEPVVLGGNLIKLADFKYFDPGELPKIELKIITCDTAMKTKEHNDHSVLQCWGRSARRAFLIDQVRGKWQPAELLRVARTFWDKHNKASSPVAYIAIEEAAAGFSLMLEMRKKGIPAKGIVRHKDKVTRVKDILAYQATGMVYLPRDASWLPGFEVELAQFREDGKSTKDDQCVLGGTLIETEDRGMVPIEQVHSGDWVRTRWGFYPVMDSRITGKAEDIWVVISNTGRTLFCTANHPIWVDRKGFIRVDAVSDGDKLTVWQDQKVLYSEEFVFAAIPIAAFQHIAGIIDPVQETSVEEYSTSIRRSGKLHTATSHNSISSITRMETPSIISLRIWRFCHVGNIWRSIAGGGSSVRVAPSNWPTWKRFVLSLRNGMDLLKGFSGIASTAKKFFGRSPIAQWFVPGVGGASKLEMPEQPFAPHVVLHPPEEKIQTSTSSASARSAERSLEFLSANYPAKAARLRKVVRELAQSNSVKVYNLKVGYAHEYMAEGILTHNCDAFADGVALLLVKGTSILSVLTRPGQRRS